MEQPRFIVAIGLSLLLLLLYQQFVINPYRHRAAPAASAPAANQNSANEPAANAPAQPLAQSPAIETPLALKNLAAPAPENGGVVVDTDTIHARISPLGARLVEYRLKDYRRSVSNDSEPMDLVTAAPILPMTLQIGKDASDAALQYRADRTTVSVEGDDHEQVVFTAESPEGLRIEKRYVFSGRGYLFDVQTSFSGSGTPSTAGLVLTPVPLDSPTGKENAVVLADRHFTEKAIKDLQKGPSTVAAPAWAGFAAQYFLAAGIPANGATAGAFIAPTDTVPIVRVETPVDGAKANFTVYVGPKDRDVLAASNHDLDRALDFGWFWFIAVPLLQALRMLHVVTGNYGVAIIVLTTMVKVVTIPLTRTTFRNMREMQKIQPQMAKLRERFKDDQAALQKEMMELYRRHRVNPLSGCLPMLLQFPIFVGLYNALSHAIELRHAPFALWIRDLSAPEWLPILGFGVPVLTILMGASMFVQQWLSPQQGDPTQQRMMMFMPLVFTFMFMNFPAGLVLYWLVNNVLSIGQQYLMLRSSA
jgi:YidC/Oxa1 family membrane protein insertase